MNTTVTTKNENSIEEMQRRVSEKRKTKSLIQGALQSVKYIGIIVLLMALSLAISFGISALFTGDMFNVFKYNLEQPVMLIGGIAAMLLIKKEGKVSFPKSKKFGVAFFLGLFLVGFTSTSAYAYFLVGIANADVNFDLKRQIAAMIIAPICEEFTCRYLLTAAIRKNKEGVHVIALILTALIFTMMHLPSGIIGFSRYMVVALFIGYIYQKTGSFKGCIFNHFGANIGSTCVYLLANNFSQSVKLTIASAFTVLTILGVVIVIKEMKKASKDNSEMRESSDISPVML